MKPADTEKHREPKRLPPGTVSALKALLMPPGFVVALALPTTAALMYWVFGLENRSHPLSYAAYVASAYAVVVIGVFIAQGKPSQRVRALARKNRRVGRLLDDKDHRAVAGVHLSLCVDTLWAMANFAMGALSGSLWFVTLAVYYLLHALMRIVLLRRIHTGASQGKATLHSEQRACLTCGILIVVSILAVSGMVVLVMDEQGGFSYSGTLIYVVALYAFYALVMGIVNVVTYRKHASPVLFTIVNVNLATAFVSIFALEVAMLSAFGTADDNALRTTMIWLTGLAVGLLVAAVGISLIVRSAKTLRALRG